MALKFGSAAWRKKYNPKKKRTAKRKTTRRATARKTKRKAKNPTAVLKKIKALLRGK